MPVKCVNRNGKYRIVSPNGQIETTQNGVPRDGGGHDSMSECEKQARAINAADYNESSLTALVYNGSEPIACAAQNTDKDGVPKQRFKKDMIRPGTYKHPVMGWTIDVTAERLNRWVAAFRAMRDNGIDVEVPVNHSYDARDNIGYVVDMFVEDDAEGVPTLYGIHEIIGSNNIELVKTNRNVSVAISKDFKDGKGNAYGEAIVHSSVVQQPVVPGQSDFVPIAASRMYETQNVLYKVNTMEKGETMPNVIPLDKLRELLGAGDDLTEENALSRLNEMLKSKDEKLSTLQKENIDLQGKLDESGKKDTKAASKVDPTVAEMLADAAGDKLDNLVQNGKITPAVRDELSKVLVGKEGERNMSALAINQATHKSLFKNVVEALSKNDVALLGEKTGVQVLSREVHGETDEKELSKQQEKTTTEMLEMAGAPVKKN